MIPRYQKIIFFLLLVVSIAMTLILVRLREQAHERLLRGEDIAPTSAPAVAAAEQATLVLANDSDGTLTSQLISLPLPKDDGARARALWKSCSSSTPALSQAIPSPLRIAPSPRSSCCP